MSDAFASFFCPPLTVNQSTSKIHDPIRVIGIGLGSPGQKFDSICRHVVLTDGYIQQNRVGIIFLELREGVDPEGAVFEFFEVTDGGAVEQVGPRFHINFVDIWRGSGSIQGFERIQVLPPLSDFFPGDADDVPAR